MNKEFSEYTYNEIKIGLKKELNSIKEASLDKMSS